MKRNVVLTERDEALLESLLQYRYLSTTQLQRLHFPSLQTATRRLRLLAELDLVDSFRAPGVDERLIMLKDKGARLVADRLDVPLEQLNWKIRRQPKDYLFLKHFLATGDFRIALTKACRRRPGLTLLGFIPEHLGEKNSKGNVKKYIRDVVADAAHRGRRIVHTPDAVFALERNGTPALFFLEIDRGTEVLNDAERGVLKAFRFYLKYLLAKDVPYQRYQDDFGARQAFKGFRVLFVTTSKKRLENMRALGSQLDIKPASAKRFLWLTTAESVDEVRILGQVWASLDVQDGSDYGIVPIDPSLKEQDHGYQTQR